MERMMVKVRNSMKKSVECILLISACLLAVGCERGATERSSIRNNDEYDRLEETRNYLSSLLNALRDEETAIAHERRRNLEYALELLEETHESDFAIPRLYRAHVLHKSVNDNDCVFLQIMWLEDGFRTTGLELLDESGEVLLEWNDFEWDGVRQDFLNLNRFDVITVVLENDLSRPPETPNVKQYIMNMDSSVLYEVADLRLVLDDGTKSESIPVFVEDAVQQLIRE